VVRRLLARVSRLEWSIAASAAVMLLALVVVEPDILQAPFENERTILFTVGGTVIAAVALVAMLRFDVAPIVRVLVLGVPFVVVAWWLLSPFFIDDVVRDEFETSIAEAGTTQSAPSTASDSSVVPPSPAAPAGPRLLGAGMFVGLAGHEGTGDAGFFELEDMSQVLRLENFDIENGPALELYVVPGAGRVDLAEGSVHLGALRGNVGDQTYALPGDFALAPGAWTVLVWCDAFDVEFVGATVNVA
jgi:hypothetical protein